ncbi:MAG: hypothetical protein DRG59_10910 [Deltaproteobacteria bacterium]|nr:MAG: hypothetical protein DRG59_10910 [Deltaproteobacteria bacterium]
MLQEIYWKLLYARKVDLVDVSKPDWRLAVTGRYRFGTIVTVRVGDVHIPGIYVEVTRNGRTIPLPRDTSIALKVATDVAKALTTPKGRLLLLKLSPYDREHLVTTLREITAISSWLNTFA